MGIFDFLKNIGKKVDPGQEAASIENNIRTALSGRVENLNVAFDDGNVTLSGTVDSQATKEKAVLLAGNIKSVEKVNDERLTVRPTPQAEVELKEPAFIFYTIQSGDSLSKIAKRYYGDATKWNAVFEANREVIEDPDLIYPGQQIRVPANPNA